MDRPGRMVCWFWLWGICYAVLVGVVVWTMFAARDWAIVNLSTPQSIAEWEAWRADVRAQQDEQAPVRRRVPKSAEPPALVLMRSYFGVSLAGAVVLTSVLFWMVAWMVSGMLAMPARDDESDSRVGRVLRDPP